MNIEVKELQRLSLSIDEVLVVRLSDDVDMCTVESTRDSFKKYFQTIKYWLL